MTNLRIVILIFLATMICNTLGVLYQRCILKEKHFKATTISVVMAGISLYVWKFIIKEDDMSSAAAFISYLAGDAVGTYAGFKAKLEKDLPHKPT